MTTIDTGTEDLLARKENGVGYLVMNRPEARNACLLYTSDAADE